MQSRVLSLISLIVIVILLGACAPQTTPAPAQPTTAPAAQATTAPVATTAPAAQATVRPPATAAPAAQATTAVGADANKTGGRLRLATGALIQFDQALASDGPSFEAMSNIHAYLYRMQDLGTPYPDLATAWEWKDDKTLIFKLRQGAKFHDGNDVFPAGQGREVTADDVVYSMERWLNLKGSLITSDVKDVYEAMTAVDKYTVQLKLKAPSGDLFSQVRGLSNLAIIPKEAVEKYGADFGKKPIGAGPFKFVEYVADDHLLLKRNDNYWVKCYVDEVYYKIIPDAAVALVALEAGDIDFMAGVPAAEVNRISNDARFNKFILPSKTPRMIMFPSGVAEFKEKKFRQAIAQAIDSQKIGPSIYGAAVAEAGCGNASKGVPGAIDDLCQKYFQFSPDTSKKLLAELGWTPGSDGILQKDGKRMEDIKINTFTIANMPRVIEIVITQLKAVGLPVVAEVVEFGAWGDLYLRGAKDSQTNQRRLMLWAGCGGVGGLQQCWTSGGSFTTVLGYNDPEVFDLIKQANVTPDVKKQDEILKKATEKVFGEYWVINATGPIGALQAAHRSVTDYGSRYHFDNVCTTKNNVWIDKTKK